MMIIKLILTILVHVHVCTSANITEPPQDVTALFGDMAIFNCTGEGDTLKWTHNGDIIIAQEQRISIVHHNVSDGVVSSSLYISATIENDDGAIGCSIITYSPFDIDNIGAILTVRRIGPVKNLSLSIDDVPYVIWTIPSVIAPDIPVRRIRYTVKLLEGGNITTSTVNDIDGTYYQFTDITVLNCTVYTANVTAYDVKNKMYSSDAVLADNYIISTGKSKLYKIRQ